jgi:hypothetical protein
MEKIHHNKKSILGMDVTLHKSLKKNATLKIEVITIMKQP